MIPNSEEQERGELQKILELVIHHAQGVWSNRWIAVMILWLVCLAGWAWVYTLPNNYGASAVVYVDTDSVLRPLLKGLAVESNVMNEVAVMTRAIVARPNLEAVAREIDLDIKASTAAQFEGALSALEERIEIGRDRQGVYTISYHDHDRETALTVVKSLLDTFVEDTLGSKTEDSAKAEQTLRTQIQAYEERMLEAETRLEAFKRENVGMMPGERGDYYQQLQRALSELDEVSQKLRIAQQKRAALERQLAGEEPVFGIMTPVAGGAPSTTDARIAELQQRLSDLSIEYTDKHPEVVRTKSLLEELRQRRQDAAGAQMESGAPMATNPLDLNPVYQNMKIQLSDIQVEMASLRADRQERQARVDRLKGLVDVIPQVESELTRLNRDYDVVRDRYQEMLSRWENLQTSQQVGSSSDNVNFRVIEPPFAPSEPVGPPRPLYAAGVFVLAAGAGIGFALLLSLLRPVFFRTTELRFAGVPVLGGVAQIARDDVDRSRAFGMAAFAASIAGAVVALSLLWVFSDPAAEIVRRLI